MNKESFTKEDSFEDSEGRESKSRKWLVNGGLILLAFLLIFALRQYLLGHFFPSIGKGQSIAKLSYLFNKVVHRASRRADFKKATLEQELFENDALRTYENSFSEITFEQGGTLRLDQNTLIILRGLSSGLFGKPPQYALFLQQGNIFLNLKGGEEVAHFIETPNDKFLLRTSEWQGEGQIGIELRPDGKTRITGYTGKGPIEINGKRYDLSLNHFYILSQNQTPINELLPPSVIKAEIGENPIIFTQSMGQEVSVTWDPITEAKSYVIEVATDEAFQKVIAQANTPRNYFTLKTTGQGDYFWRMRSVQEGKMKKLEGEFTVHFDSPSAWSKIIIDPQRNVVDDQNQKTTIYFQSDYPLISFNWTPVKNASRYRLEIFLDPNFEELVLAKDTQKSFYSIEPGVIYDTKYYWQTVALTKKGDPMGVSDVFELNLMYDNAIPFLNISQPKPGTIVNSLETAVEGILPRKSKLYVNDQRVKINRRGKFLENIKLEWGTNQIIFKVIGSGGRLEYHGRSVTAIPPKPSS